MKSKPGKRIVSIVLCFVLAVSSAVYGFGATSVSDLENELASIQNKIEANQKKLDEIAEDKQKQQEYLDTLEEQLGNTQAQMSTLGNQIDAINGDISKVNQSIKQLNTQINTITDNITNTQNNIVTIQNTIKESYDTLADRLRSSYMTGEDSNLKILLGADSIASFLTRLELMKRVSENDTRMINEFKGNVVNLKQAKSVLEEQKLELEDSRSQLSIKNENLSQKKAEYDAKNTALEKSVDEYESRYKEIEAYIQKLDKSSSTYNDYIEKLEADYDNAEAEMSRIIASAATSTRPSSESTTLPSENADPSVEIAPNVSPDGFMWPVGNISCYVSSDYGYRTHPLSGKYKFHGGIDITASGIEGKSIYASRAGTVIGAIYGDSSYGNYVILDHGDGYTTIYAHCLALNCSTGDYVAKGQVIAKVGSTGNSSGPHLHFEVRKNGERQSPWNYVSKP